jgi:hypothetical protein
MISEIIGIHYLVNSRAGVRVPAGTLARRVGPRPAVLVTDLAGVFRS